MDPDRSRPADRTPDLAPRLQVVLARAGVASRRDAEALIVAGRVSIDGVTVQELGTRVDPARHRVAVDGRPVSAPVAARYLALNKPTGYVSTADDPEGRPTVMRLVPAVPHLFPVGRLDVASEGLLLFTTDGEWAQRASHPRFECLKEYEVDVVGDASPSALATMRAPMLLVPGEWTSGARVDLLGATRYRARLRVVIGEGRNRQVRRMCAAVGLEVVALVRVRVGGVALHDLAPGEWRELTEQEVESIRRQVAAPGRRPARPAGAGPALRGPRPDLRRRDPSRADR